MPPLPFAGAPPTSLPFLTVARTYDEIDDHLRAWIGRQPMFFVGSAPLAADGHINVSPKGPGGTLRVLGPRRVAYLDYVGSGAETIAHVRENGRVVVMFCAFEGPPRIVRLHGRGEYVLTDDPRFDELLAEAGFEEPTIPEGRRAIVRRRRHPHRLLVRLRRAADGLRGRAPAHGRVDAQARAGPGPGRVPRLPGRAQRGEHRRPARRHALSTGAQPFSSG